MNHQNCRTMQLTTFLLIAAAQIVASQKCLYHKQEDFLECWELTLKTDFVLENNLTNATKLVISSSNLTFLSEEVFEPFEQLKIVMMSGNAIKLIEDKAFRKARNLEYIDFSYNQIEYLDPTVFATNSEIQAIDLSNNQLKVLNIDIFKNLPLLETFNLQGNPIDFCEINTHFALLELNFRNINTNIDMQSCSDYYELVPRKLELQMSEMIHYLNIFNALTLLLLGAVLVSLLALLTQSKKTGGWRLPNAISVFTGYDRLKNLPETKIPQAV